MHVTSTVDERGSALLFVMLVIFVGAMISAAYLGLASSDVARSRDYTRYKQAMGVAESGMDKAVLELKNAVFKYGAPNVSDLQDIEAPTIANFSFLSPDGENAYIIDPDGDFRHSARIEEGRWTGMYGDYQRYRLRVGATRDGSTNGVVLTQTMQCLAIPVFQFGVFYDEDLEILPGPEMIFAGPVHTNGNLFIGSNNRVRFDDLITVHQQIHRRRKDDNSIPSGDVLVQNQHDEYKSMRDSGGIIDHSRDDWPVEALRRWGGRISDSAHEVPEMRLPLPTASPPHDILKRADPDNDDPRLLANKFETKADIKIWQDESGELHGELPDGSEFPLIFGESSAIGGAININPSNSSNNEFYLVKADGTQITRDDLHDRMPDWEGEATLVRIRPKGNSNNNSFIVDGEAFPVSNSSVYEITAADTMAVRVYNDNRNSQGKANGEWWIAPTAGAANLKADNLPLGTVHSVASFSEFADWREGNGSPKTMKSLDINVEALAKHPDYPTDGAVVYAFNEFAGDGETGVIRLVDGKELPYGGLTVATPDPIYIRGDYNTEGLKKPSLVAGDAVNILSNAWNDADSWEKLNKRRATQSQVNTVVMTGNTETQWGNYNGGLENVLRFLENWNGRELVFRGSIVCFWQSETATGPWVYGNNRYEAPIRNWGYDEMYRDPRNAPPGIPNVIALEALSWRQDNWTAEELGR